MITFFIKNQLGSHSKNGVNKCILFMVVLISVISCKKKACTDCNALNYDSSAKADDNSCMYINEDRLGVYSVTDSIIDWSQTVWYDNYDIVIKRGGCNPNGLLISNYSNSTNSLTGNPLLVSCDIEGDSLFIHSQVIPGDNITGNSFNDFTINSTNGVFRNDSIFFKLSYSSSGDDPHYGACEGKKE